MLLVKVLIMNIDDIVPSVLKVTAKETLNIDKDLKQEDSTKTIEQLLNEEEKNSTDQRK